MPFPFSLLAVAAGVACSVGATDGVAALPLVADAAGVSAGLWTSGVTVSGLETPGTADSEGLVVGVSAKGFLLVALSPAVAGALRDDC